MTSWDDRTISCCQVAELMACEAAKPWWLKGQRPWIKAWDWLMVLVDPAAPAPWNL
jgi:hypothetical protein